MSGPVTPARLLLVDGTNIIMRCAFGGEVPLERALPTAIGMIDRAVRTVGAEFLVVAIDSPAPSWRKAECAEYKAHRQGGTSEYSAALAAELARLGRMCVAADGFEADDILATVAARAEHVQLAILSGDSDLLACTSERVRVLLPAGGGGFLERGPAYVRETYGVEPAILPHWKAIAGEPGDNVVGLGGRTPKGEVSQQKAAARKLLGAFGDLEGVIAAGEQNETRAAREAYLVRDRLRLALRLTTLRTDAPVPPLAPAACFVRAA